MKGFVPTPEATVDLMVDRLFAGRPPTASDRILDPGCGRGAFIDGILRWCAHRQLPAPRIDGIESNPTLVQSARRKFTGSASVRIEHRDFLALDQRAYDFAIGNPPYVPITSLRDAEKIRYRRGYTTASGRFDLYMLFFEKALSLLRPGGRLCFITPEKFMYVESARPLRALLSEHNVEEIRFLDEQTFGDLVTYPTITLLTRQPGRTTTSVTGRNGLTSPLRLPSDGSSWQPALKGAPPASNAPTLGSMTRRISCGVATGADEVFVFNDEKLPSDLRPFSYPTLSGRELVPGVNGFRVRQRLVMPYDRRGRLRPLAELGALRNYVQRPEVRSRLEARTCAQHKPWYAFHETPPMGEVLQPKILCKDIGERPRFWVDLHGSIVPRHSVYYIVPPAGVDLGSLCDYLNSRQAAEWLENHCQRAANNFLRLQSTVLKRLPIPDALATSLGHVQKGGVRTRPLPLEVAQ
jgi:adenine-specific DNA-methyltransferase